jgi:hypothetical protein
MDLGEFSSVGFSLCLPLVMLGLVVGYMLYMRRMHTGSGSHESMSTNWRRFLEQTGFRKPGMEQMPLEAQAAALATDYQHYLKSAYGSNPQPYTQHLIKPLGEGWSVHQESFMGYDPNDRQKYILSASWSVPLPQPPRAPFHIASKHIGGVGEALKGMMQRTTRVWQPAYAQAIRTGDPELDGRYNIWAPDAEAACRAILGSGLKELLAGCPEVDLRVMPNEVRFSDPQQKNLQAAMGGTMGAMAAGMDPGKIIDMTIPMHVRIADIVTLAARASM